MKYRIFSSYSEVQPFLPDVEKAADSHRSALGFLPASVYRQGALQGKLWVASSLENGDYLGHLLFGGTYPNLKVTQLFVAPDRRRSAVGSALIKELVAYGERYSYISISARVAADLPANDFWHNLSFQCSRQISGGKTTGRTINIRVRFLDVPLLFEQHELQSPPIEGSSSALLYEATPVSRPLVFALDINSLLDLLRHRERYEAVSSMIRAGLNHIVRLVLTEEAREELSRRGATLEASPALELLRQMPVLPSVIAADLSALIEAIRPVVFPRRSRTRKDFAKDNSDLIHLATCVHYRLAGFVTSERAMLRAAQDLKRQFALDVLSPLEFLDPDLGPHSKGVLSAQTGTDEISIQIFEERERKRVEEFLAGIGIVKAEYLAAIHPGTSGRPRRRLIAVVNETLVAFSSWTKPVKLNAEADFFLYADESGPAAERVIAHLLEVVSREHAPVQIYGLNLFHGPDQLVTRRIAVERGFRSRMSAYESAGRLFKVFVSGFVSSLEWTSFAVRLQAIAGISVPQQIPHHEQIDKSGIKVEVPLVRSMDRVSLFELETLLSPGILMVPGRSGVLVPIQEIFAEELLGDVSGQRSFLPGREALLRVEKAYFRAPRGVRLFSKGTPIVFYISGLMQAFASARITSSAIVQADQAFVQYYRQGVLEKDNILERSEKGKLHVFTFDNVMRFPHPVSYGKLKELDCVSAANLVTSQKLNHAQLLRLLVKAFSAEG